MSQTKEVSEKENFSDIKYRDQLLEHISSLYMKTECSDVVFTVEGKRIPCHKFILASCSDYFKALLYGSFSESQSNEIELKEVSLKEFQILLKYIYTGHLNLYMISEELLLGVLSLAHQYNIVQLESTICNRLSSNLRLSNVLAIYEKANLFHFSSLANECLTLIDNKAEDIMHQKSFSMLPAIALNAVISRDSFCVPEVEIFRIVCEWATHNTSLDIQDIMSAVRLPLMSFRELTRVVRPTGYFSAEEILDALQIQDDEYRSDDMYLNYRGHLLPNTLVPLAKAVTVTGNKRCCTIYDSNDETVQEPNECCITRLSHSGYRANNRNSRPYAVKVTESTEILFEFDHPYFVNSISFHVGDDDDGSIYDIKVSMDGTSWLKIVPDAKFFGSCICGLYFDSKPIKFICFSGELALKFRDLGNDFICILDENAPFYLLERGCYPRY